jgi:hypothetical protein
MTSLVDQQERGARSSPETGGVTVIELALLLGHIGEF